MAADAEEYGPSEHGERAQKKSRPPVAEAERRTAFISNLPADISDRELRLLFASSPGFIQAQKQPGKPNNVFALFDQHAAALTCVNTLRGYPVDGHEEDPLKVSLSRNNLHLPQGSVSYARVQSSGGDHSYDPYASFAGGMGQAMSQPLMNQMGGGWPSANTSAYAPADALASSIAAAFPQMQPQMQMQQLLQQQPSGYPGYPGYGASAPPPAYNNSSPAPAPYAGPVSAPPFAASRDNRDTRDRGEPNAPCDTLYLRGVYIDEQQLQRLSVTLGSINMKVMSGRNSAFVQFPSVPVAEAALSAYQSQACTTVEYSKNPLGKRSR